MKKYLDVIASALIFPSCGENKAADNKHTDTTATAPQYQFVAIEKTGVATVVKLPAQLAAYQEVSIFPKVNGYVKTVLVDIGSKDTQGKLLMVLQAPELEEAALQAKEKYTKA